MLAGVTTAASPAAAASTPRLYVTGFPVTLVAVTVTSVGVLPGDEGARATPKLRFGWSNVRGTLCGVDRSSRPEPRTVGLFPRLVTSFAVVISALLIWTGLQFGCSWCSSAAAPVTCGAAMLVPW